MAKVIVTLAAVAAITLTTTGCVPLLVGGLIGYELSKDRAEDKAIAKAPHRSICERTVDGKLACTDEVVMQDSPAVTAPAPVAPAPAVAAVVTAPDIQR